MLNTRARLTGALCGLLVFAGCVSEEGSDSPAPASHADDPAAPGFEPLLSNDPIATRASSTVQWFAGQIDNDGVVMSEDALIVATRGVFLDAFLRNEGQPWPFPGTPSPTLFGEVEKGISALLQAQCSSGAPCQFASAKDRDLMSAQIRDLVSRVETSSDTPDDPFVVTIMSAGRNRVDLDRYPNQRLTKVFVIFNKANGKFAAAYINAPAQ
jgi:hypothetical protein